MFQKRPTMAKSKEQNNQTNEINKENKIMNTNNLRPQEVKAQRTVPLKDVIYCVLIAIAVVSCTITGWVLRSNDLDRVKAEAHSIVELSKAPSKQ